MTTMTNDKSSTVSLDATSLRIEKLSVSGAPYEAAMQVASSGGDVELAVRQMLDIGGAILLHGENQATVDSVSHEVDRLLQGMLDVAAKEYPRVLAKHEQTLEQRLRELFDGTNRGSVQAQLHEVLRTFADSQKSEIAKALAEPTGVLGALRSELIDRLSRLDTRNLEFAKELTTISERLMVAREIEFERARGTAKGLVHEDRVATVVERQAAPHGDVLVDTSREVGSGGGKKGDFAVRLSVGDTAGQEVSYVVEAKDKKMGITAALKELDGAMTNRGASSGVLVFARQDQAPINGLPLRLYGGNRIITWLTDDGEISLEIASQLARALALASTAADSSAASAHEVSEALNRICALIDEAKAIARGTGAARRGLDQVDTAYKSLRTSLHDAVNELREKLM